MIAAVEIHADFRTEERIAWEDQAGVPRLWVNQQTREAFMHQKTSYDAYRNAWDLAIANAWASCSFSQ
jgi:hypothetical protein